MRSMLSLICTILLLLAISPAAEAQVKKMKIYISVDMEGLLKIQLVL